MHAYPKRTEVSPLPLTTAEGWRRGSTFGREAPDVADMLPEQARTKFIALRDRADDLAAFAGGPYRRSQELRQDKAAVETAIENLRRAYRDDENHPAIVAERETLNKISSEIARLSALANDRREKSGDARRLVARLENYIRRNDPASFELAHGLHSPTTPKNSSIDAEIEKLRAKIHGLRGEIQATIDAPISSADAKEIVRSFVRGLAANGAPDVFPVIEGARPPTLPQDFNSSPQYGDKVDVLGLMAWMFGDQFIAKLEAEIDANSDDGSALTESERTKRIAATKMTILDLERAEEALIVQAENSGLQINRRGDADPRAVLGLANTAPEPKDDY